MASPASDVVVRATGLTKSYGDIAALRGVDFEARSGEIFGLLGPNGAGKTTAMKVVATLLRADGGQASVLGKDVLAEPASVRSLIGYVPQELTADKALTGRENLKFFCRLQHVSGASMKTRIAELLELVGLTADADRLSRGYSGGMRKRLDLACGLVQEPKLLLLDEPSLGLDVHARRGIWDHVLGLAAKGVAVLITTNSMEEADALCHRVAIVDAGKVVAAGAPEELKKALGGDVISLTFALDTTMPPALPEKLYGLGIVKRVMMESGRLDLLVTANESALPRVIEAARELGARVSEARFSRPGLEAVFLTATGRRYGEPAEKGKA